MRAKCSPGLSIALPRQIVNFVIPSFVYTWCVDDPIY